MDLQKITESYHCIISENHSVYFIAMPFDKSFFCLKSTAFTWSYWKESSYSLIETDSAMGEGTLLAITETATLSAAFLSFSATSSKFCHNIALVQT